MATSADIASPSVLSADDMLALDAIAVELESPDLTAERRVELTQAIADIAEKYTCDPRLSGN